MRTKINHIKEVNIGDIVCWINGMGFEQRAEVFAADDGAKTIATMVGGIWQHHSVKQLLGANKTVEIFYDDSCHICGKEGGH